MQELKGQLQREWGNTVVSNWKLWCPAQLINFAFVPGHLQVLRPPPQHTFCITLVELETLKAPPHNTCLDYRAQLN